jgi:hypothetical protein
MYVIYIPGDEEAVISRLVGFDEKSLEKLLKTGKWPIGGQLKPLPDSIFIAAKDLLAIRGYNLHKQTAGKE